MFDCPEGFEEEAKADFLLSLDRQKKEPTQAMLNGLAFEDQVYAQAHGLPREPHEQWEHGIRKVASIIGNAPVQVKAKREIDVCGMTFLVYGILDALRAGIIYDVKFRNKSLGSDDIYGKYLDSPQHPAYFYIVPEATEFRYLVSDGEDVYQEVYARENTRPIGEIIKEFVASMESMGLMDRYKQHWVAL
jgi:hypothetical protein